MLGIRDVVEFDESIVTSFAVSSRRVIVYFHLPSSFSTNLTNTCMHAVVGVTPAMTNISE